MITLRKCAICNGDFRDADRVIFSARETFVFKSANVPDAPVLHKTKYGQTIEVSAAAVLSPDQLRESRKDYLRTAVVNTFCDWGKAQLPADAFNFRHQWCEPVRAGMLSHSGQKHMIRLMRMAPGGING